MSTLTAEIYHKCLYHYIHSNWKKKKCTDMLSNYISCLPVSDFQQQSDSFFNQKMCTSIVILLTHAPIKRLRRTLIEHPNFTLEVTQWPIHNHIFLLLLKSFQHVIIKLFAEFFSFNLQPRSPCIKTALSM